MPIFGALREVQQCERPPFRTRSCNIPLDLENHRGGHRVEGGPACLTVGLGHPILAPPTSVAGCQRVLAKAARATSGQMLAEALERTLEDYGCKLMVMKYGMLPGEEAFELLLAAKEAMAHQMDSLTLQRVWNIEVVDWATQSILALRPVLVFPRGDLREIEWVHRHKVRNYSLLGKAGGGFGGVQIGGAEGGLFSKAICYLGRWVHHVKALGMPAPFPTKNATSKWFCQQCWQAYKAFLQTSASCQPRGCNHCHEGGIGPG